VRLAAPALRDALEPALAALARGEEPAEAVVVKRSRARSVLRLPLPGGGVFLKWSRREGLRWRPSDAAREYRNLARVRAVGIAAVEPLALAERSVGLRRETVLVTRAAPGATVVAEALPGLDAAAQQALLGAAAALARRLHEAGLWHRDLHVGNLLRSGGELLLVDLQKLVALPFAPPLALRARDLVWLVSDGRLGTAASPREIASAYLGAAPDGPGLERLAAALARATTRAARARLISRERRCVLASTGFRIESRGTQRVLRRADVTTSAALQAAAAARGAEPLRLATFTGGPPPGPAPEPFERGQGAPELADPAGGAALLRSFGAGLGIAVPLALAHPGLRAWRMAHALLLRGLDTPAPLALVETWRLGWVARSVLITRSVDDAIELAKGVAGDAERARAIGVQLARLHARGVELARAALHLCAAARVLVALAPEGARLHSKLSAARAERDLERIVRALAPAEREALVTAYRAAARS
jgi:tRNA A-37 threonylcarbamoyl transferase component Bud32